MPSLSPIAMPLRSSATSGLLSLSSLLHLFRPTLGTAPSTFPSNPASPTTGDTPILVSRAHRMLAESPWLTMELYPEKSIRSQKYHQVENALNILSLWGIMAQCMLPQICSDLTESPLSSKVLQSVDNESRFRTAVWVWLCLIIESALYRSQSICNSLIVTTWLLSLPSALGTAWEDKIHLSHAKSSWVWYCGWHKMYGPGLSGWMNKSGEKG